MTRRLINLKARRAAHGFTLIELLAVIAIIALMAGLVVGLSGLATAKSRAARVTAEHHNLVSAIEAYKAELGNYPPDNRSQPDLNKRPGLNSLFYELSGATFSGSGSAGVFQTQNKLETIKATDLNLAFGVKGVDNSARNKKDIPYRGITFRESQYKELADFPDAEVLVLPLKGPTIRALNGKGGRILNPWLYDASSTNRHNRDGFDLWGEYNAKDRVITVGNWKD
jgi:prepilin-type N-terminal cleavage/methylation domain-containing protein